MKPKGFVEKVHDNYMRIINPDNGATVTGEAGTTLAVVDVPQCTFLMNGHS
jgi:hypothetical protein